MIVLLDPRYIFEAIGNTFTNIGNFIFSEPWIVVILAIGMICLALRIFIKFI